MFKIGLSCEIKKDSFNCHLNGLLSFKSIVFVYRICILYIVFSAILAGLIFKWLDSHQLSSIKYFLILFNQIWWIIDAVSRSYAERHEDSNDFIMIHICSWRQYLLYFYFWCIFVFHNTHWSSKFCQRDMEMS